MISDPRKIEQDLFAMNLITSVHLGHLTLEQALDRLRAERERQDARNGERAPA